jgi:hypothetical protein
MKTSELTGPALDWAVAKAIGGTIRTENGVFLNQGDGYEYFTPSSSWGQGGQIIDANPTMQFWMWGGRPDYRPGELQCVSMAAIVHGGTQHKTWFGKTKLIAAMRCYVASKLGGEIEIPKELL